MLINTMQSEEATWVDELSLLDAMCAQHLDRFNLYQNDVSVDKQKESCDEE